jgi:hypothetical protein
MKSRILKIKVVLLLSITISFMGCKWGEQETEALCNTIEYADLIISGIESTFVESNENGDIYDIIHIALNTIDNIVCEEGVSCEDSKTAGKHQYRQQISYSATNPNEPFPQIIDSLDFDHDPLLPCATVEDNATVQFLQDGYYFIDGIVDIFNIVQERDEDNNTETVSESKTKSDNSNRVVIHVDRGLEPTYKDGKLQYIKVIKKSTTYYNNER